MAMIAKNRTNSTWTPLSNEETNNKVGNWFGRCPFLSVSVFQSPNKSRYFVILKDTSCRFSIKHKLKKCFPMVLLRCRGVARDLYIYNCYAHTRIIMAEAIRTTVVPITQLIRTTVVLITPLIC